jgi:hypothetical protein
VCVFPDLQDPGQVLSGEAWIARQALQQREDHHVPFQVAHADLRLVATADPEAICWVSPPGPLRDPIGASHPGHLPGFDKRLHRGKVAHIAVQGPEPGTELREVVGARDDAAEAMGLVIERDHAQPRSDVAAPCAQSLIVLGGDTSIEPAELSDNAPVGLREIKVEVFEA